MKKYIFTFLAILGLGLSALGQENACIKEAVTIPGIPYSSWFLQNIPQINNTHDPRFQVGWQWWLDPANYQTIPITDMGISAGQNYGPIMQPMNSLGYGGHYNYLNLEELYNTSGGQLIYNELMWPELGWELMTMNIGRFPDFSTPVDYSEPGLNSFLRPIPYLIFYNKYTGKMRLFVRYGNNTNPSGTINAADFHLKYFNPDEMSGMFRLLGGHDQALDQFSSLSHISSRVPSPGEETLWFSTDFQMAYDPCVCNHESTFGLWYRFFNTANVSLNGRSVSVTGVLSQEDLFSATGAYNLEQLNSFLTMPNGNVTEGLAIYGSMVDMIEDYIQKLENYKEKLQVVNEYNAQLESDINLLKAIKALYQFGVGFIPKVGEKLGKLMGSGYDIVIANLEKDKKVKPTSPNMPSVTTSEMSFSGTISQSAPSAFSRIRTPGSQGANEINNDFPSQFPLYNEALGVFALLKTPKLKVSNVKTINPYLYMKIAFENFNDLMYYNLYEVNVHNQIQMQLNQPLEYVFNPALNIKEHDINVSFEVYGSIDKDTNNAKWTLPSLPSSQGNAYDFDDLSKTNTLHNKMVNIQSNQFDFTKDESLEAFYDADIKSLKFNTIHLPINSMNNNVYSFEWEQNFKHPNNFCEDLMHWGCGYPNHYDDNHLDGINPPHEYYVYTTGSFGPILWDAYYFQNYHYGNFNNLISLYEDDKALHYKIDSIVMKLSTFVKFEEPKPNGEPHEYFYVTSYKLDLEEDVIFDYENAINPNLVGSNLDYTQYAEDLFLGDIVFDGADIEGCTLDGNLYTCKAWDNIYITDNLSVANGYEVNIEAGNEIEVFNETIIHPEITLSIVPVLDLSNPTPPQTALQVASFCAGNDYKANELQKSIQNMIDSLAQANPAPEPLPTPIEFIIFPNPTTGASQAGIYLPELATVSITIIDVSGKVVGSPVQNLTLANGRNVQNLETESLQPGVYLVHLVVNGEKFVQRLVKQ